MPWIISQRGVRLKIDDAITYLVEDSTEPELGESQVTLESTQFEAVLFVGSGEHCDKVIKMLDDALEPVDVLDAFNKGENT